MNKKIRTLTLALALTFASLAGTPFAHGQAVPSFINYQGRLTTATGNPIADGNVTLTLRLFGGPTGGSPIWDSGTITVPVRGGVFSVLLGSGGMPILTPSVFTLNGLLRSAWLEIEPQGSPPLTPRQQIATVPFAYMAETVSDGAITGPKLADGSVSQPKISVNSIDSTRLATDLASLGKITNGRLQSEANRLIVWGDSSQSRVSFLGAPGVPSGIEFNRQPFGQAFTLEQRSDVGGNNSDLKLLRYVLGGYQGIALQVQNSTGNVGVNSSAPKERLHVEGNLLVSNGGNTANAGGAVNFSAYPSTENSRTVFAYIKGALSLGDSNGQVGNLEFWTRPATSSNSFVRRMMIRLDGAVAIGDGEPNGATLSIYGSANKRDNSSLWDAWSDQRLKKDISDIENPLSRLLRLKGRTFAWRDTMDMAKHNPGRKMGFIAQETEKVFPEWVRQAENGYKLLNPEGIYALTVEAIREQQNQIETLRKENGELKSRLEAQDRKIEAILREVRRR